MDLGLMGKVAVITEADSGIGKATAELQQNQVSFDQAVETFLDQQRPHLELHRRGQPEEVAAVIGFLCSERSSFV